MGRGEVAVTGLGLVTVAGGDAETVWKVLAEGRSLASADPELADVPIGISCRLDDFDAVSELGPRLARRLDRFAHMGVVAGRRAVADAGLEIPAGGSDDVGVILGVGSNSLHTYPDHFAKLAAGEPTRVSPLALPRSVPNMAAGEVAADLGLRGPNFTVSSACASGSNALGIARDLLLSGTCDVVLAGGTESGRSRMTATTFAQMRALSSRTGQPGLASRPFDRDRDGFVLSEGAAVLVLERLDHALARGARPRALLRGYGASADAYHPFSPPSAGRRRRPGDAPGAGGRGVRSR